MKLQEYLRVLRCMPCRVCYNSEVTLHHPHSGSISQAGITRGAGEKTSDWLQIPLCVKHHTGDHGIDSSFGVERWEKVFGSQLKYLEDLCEYTGINAFKEAGYDKEGRRYVRRDG